ncbi:DMT family transporter [Macrococcus capreoli]|uniref:DMT family transporter n=1 Tax=Macrococcus capreoli TaxID=2982690 RepID=UPI0021D5D865|nr:multidrug efflux SMR transporter [Macrococcus sp. TMW 2.2395]MCU7558338.1 multidrug efflux SMR transporter [Macrococcus sp. TMW 2.2395]
MNWIKIIVAAIFEVCWVVGLAHSDVWYEWLLTCISVSISFYLLLNASKYLPVGTSYAVFVGLGATLVTIADVVFFNQPLSMLKILLMSTLIIGVVGLKLATPEEAK